MMKRDSEIPQLQQDDQEYSSHLQNEKKDISLQLEQLNAELKKKQAAYEQHPATQADFMSQEGDQQSLIKELREKT